MKTFIKGIIALPVTYVMFTIVFLVTNLSLAALYSLLSSVWIAIIPVIVLWSVLHCLCVRYVLRNLVSNGIYYLVSQFVVLIYIVFTKVLSYLWYSHSYGESMLPAEVQRSFFVGELALSVWGAIFIVYTLNLFYKVSK